MNQTPPVPPTRLATNETVSSASPLTLIARAVPPSFSAWLGASPAERWPDGRFLVHIRHIRAGLAELFDQCDTPMAAPAQWWIEDIAALAERFVALTGQDRVDVRLERVTDNACSRFHKDNVPIRLVTTYYGPSTELVPEEFGARALTQQQDYGGPLERLQAGDVAIFRGGSMGIVHRSPPIAHTGEVRSFLCLNTLSSVSPDLWEPEED